MSSCTLFYLEEFIEKLQPRAAYDCSTGQHPCSGPALKVEAEEGMLILKRSPLSAMPFSLDGEGQGEKGQKPEVGGN